MKALADIMAWSYVLKNTLQSPRKNLLPKLKFIFIFLLILFSTKIYSQSETCALANGTSYVLGTWTTANGVNIGTTSEGITGTCDAVSTGELDTWFQFQTDATHTGYLIYVQGIPDFSNVNTTSGDFRPNVELRSRGGLQTCGSQTVLFCSSDSITNC